MQYIFALVACLLLVAGTLGTLWYLNTPPYNSDPQLPFAIHPQEPFRAIATRLERHNIIRSALLMRGMAQFQKLDRSIQSGSYAIPTTLTTQEIIVFLTTGRQLLIRVTIPEGLTISKIADIFNRREIVSADAFLMTTGNPDIIERFGIPSESVEGYLFPDTYFFTQDQDAEQVVTQMLTRFYDNLTRRFPEAASMSPPDIHRLVIMASLIEREYVDQNDAPFISSVFYNRLARNMRLEACSTVVYILTELRHQEHPTRLFFSDLEIDSPYNTYRNIGLPPAPIANPGNIAIDAALHPAESEYLYFVLENQDSTSHTFSTTFSEHTRARALYIRSRN